MKKIVLFEIDYNEFDKLVSTTYGREYEIVAEEELNNYSCKKVDDIKKEELDKWGMSSLADWISGKKHQAPGLYTLLTDMCNNGVIEPGNYLINISW